MRPLWAAIGFALIVAKVSFTLRKRKSGPDLQPTGADENDDADIEKGECETPFTSAEEDHRSPPESEFEDRWLQESLSAQGLGQGVLASGR